MKPCAEAAAERQPFPSHHISAPPGGAAEQMSASAPTSPTSPTASPSLASPLAAGPAKEPPLVVPIASGILNSQPFVGSFVVPFSHSTLTLISVSDPSCLVKFARKDAFPNLNDVDSNHALAQAAWTTQFEDAGIEALILVYFSTQAQPDGDKLDVYKAQGTFALTSEQSSVVVKFSALANRSELGLDANELEFEPGRITRELTIRNMCTAPGAFRLSYSPCVSVMAYDSATVIQRGVAQTLAGLGHVRVHVRLDWEAADKQSDNLYLIVENARDAFNTIRVVIRRNLPPPPTLQLHHHMHQRAGSDSGLLRILQPETMQPISLLNFGDVYASQVATATIHLRNDAFERLEVALDSTEGTRVRFFRQTHEPDQEEPMSMLLDDDLATEESVIDKGGDVGSRFAIDSLFLDPNTGVDLVCAFKPSHPTTNPLRAQRQGFRVLLKVQKHVYTLPCEARVVQSFVSVKPLLLDFGDCSVGELRTMEFSVQNHSDAQAVVKVSVLSKAVTVNGGGEVTCRIDPLATVQVRVQLVPRRVNPAYNRDITVSNVMDPKNVCTVTVHSSNVDPHRLAYHASLYKMVPLSQQTESKMVNFSGCMINSTNVRLVRVTSLCDYPLVLGLVLSPELEAFVSTLSAQHLEQLARPFELLPPSSAHDVMAEHSYVQAMEARLRDWQVAKSRQEIVAVSSVTVPPRTTFLFALCFVPKSDSRQTQLTGRLFYDSSIRAGIKIISVNQELLRRLSKTVGWAFSTPPATVDDVPMRDIPIRATVASSALCLVQSHIHFGAIRHAWERRNATISLMNKSAVPLLYRLGDRGCVHVHKGSAVGVIRPFDSRSVVIEFVPNTFSGLVEETLSVINVLDPSSSVSLVVKAKMSIEEHFRVSEEPLDFGACLVGTTSLTHQILTLTNTTSKPRELIVQASKNGGPEWPEGHAAVFAFRVVEEIAGTFPRESEQVENLERALRVAERKKDQDKVAVLRRKLDELAPRKQQTESALRPAELRPQRHYPLRGSVAVSVPPYSSARLALWLHVRTMSPGMSFDGEAQHRGLNIYEKKQGAHVVKQVPFCCRLMEQLHLSEDRSLLRSFSTDEAREAILVHPMHIDFGPVHVNPISASHGSDFTGAPMTFKLEVTNKTKASLLLSARASSAQLDVFSTGEQVVDRVLLDAGNHLGLQIVFRPMLKAEAWTGSCARFNESLTLTGEGIGKFELVVPVTGILGLSLMQVPDQRIPGVLRIVNGTELLPLRVSVSCAAEDVSIPQPLVTLPPAGSGVVTVLYKGKDGIVFREVSIRNMDSGEELVETVALVHGGGGGLALDHDRPSLTLALPLTDGDVVSKDTLANDVCKVRNVTNKRLYLKVSAYCSLGTPPSVVGKGLRSSALGTQMRGKFSQLAEGFIESGDSLEVLLRFTKGSKMRPGSFKGWLAFSTHPSGVECAAVSFHGEACESSFVVSASKVNAGEVGIWTQWSPKRFLLCTLTNPMVAPAQVRAQIIAPPTSPSSSVPSGPLWRAALETTDVLSLPPRGIIARSVWVVIHVSKEARDGEHMFHVRLTNQLNPSAPATDVEVAFTVVSKRYVMKTSSGEHLDVLKMPDVMVAQSRAVNAWFSLVNPSSVRPCELKMRTEDRPDLLAQLSLVQRGSGAVVSTLELSPGERVDLRVVLHTKPGCPARGEDIVWGLFEVEVPGEDVTRVAVCGRALGEPVFRAFPSNVLLVVDGSASKVTVVNDLHVDVACSLNFKDGGVASAVGLSAESLMLSGLSQTEIELVGTRPGSDVLLLTSSLGPVVEIQLVVEATPQAALTGCVNVCRGLYEIDAGILDEPRSWTLQGVSGRCLCLVGPGEWLELQRVAKDAMLVKLRPPLMGNVGFFSGYLVLLDTLVIVRIKMEVVAANAPLYQRPNAAGPGVTGQVRYAGLLPAEADTGPLFFGRGPRHVPFSLHNPDPDDAMVFQVGVTGQRGGLAVWTSMDNTIGLEHSRITVNPRSSTRVYAWVVVPDVQTEAFGPVEINTTCRHVKDSSKTTKLIVPPYALKPTWRATTVSDVPGEVRVSVVATEPVYVVGLDTVSASFDSLNRLSSVGSGGGGEEQRNPGLVRCVGSGMLTLRCEATSPVRLYIASQPADVVSFTVRGSVLAPVAHAASRLRDAIEMELVKAFLEDKLALPFAVIGSEIVSLLHFDAGGRGPALARLWYCLVKDPDAKSAFHSRLRAIPDIGASFDDLTHAPMEEDVAQGVNL